MDTTKTNQLSSSVIGYWDATEMDMSAEYSRKIKGSLALTKSEIVFFRYAWLSGKAKEWRRIPISGIKSINKMPVFKFITIAYNKAPQGSGALRRFFSRRKISYKIQNWESFIENIRRLNPNIKINK